MSIVAEGAKKASQMYIEVMEGLEKPQKTLPSKYFYDKRGSELFEKICKLDEYYPTRTELKIMEENIHEITETLGEQIQLIELGSGSSFKTRLLLDYLENIHSYTPVDISEEFLQEVVKDLKKQYPQLPIKPVAADYTKPFEVPEAPYDVRKVAYYPGSTIGNFSKDQAAEFIALIAELIEEDGGLLIGFDLIKDRDKLIDAYDDDKGVTAEFNKNILRRINRELDADFDPDAFEHKAVFNEDKSRIEMHLKSKIGQKVEILDAAIHFKKGETIHTENSHKYSLESFKDLTGGHLRPVKTWIDEDEFFAVQYLEK